MSQCPQCAASLPAETNFCGRCGASIRNDATATSAPTIGSAAPTPSSVDGSRFLPGTVLAGRYRIFGLIGRGGMGEVYRADDLKLGQTVALKFLPEQADATRRARLMNEVRLTRQVSHSSVCRVYDIGEVDGHTFLSMEFIDGEDLASLLRRIGRLPGDKANEIARQLCAGLAAAHEQGVLHRDFKPANVMIDGRGRARITDFGLAALSGDVAGDDIRSGTPKYMSPEQLAGKEVTERSDLYALGLVLYELFTGKTPFDADSPVELLRLQSESSPTIPSSHLADIDPGIERAMMRCLERDPAARPSSALTVAASLPGGDPLAAALAAGETPSPEMVADAGDAGGWHPALAGSLLVFALIGLLGSMMLYGRLSWFDVVPIERPTQALVDRAEQMIVDLGYDERQPYRVYGFHGIGRDYSEYLQESATDEAGLAQALRDGPPPYHLWYRNSPRPLVAWSARQRVESDNPPLNLPGMTWIEIGSSGRLERFTRIIPDKHEPGAMRPLDDWASVFALAGLDLASFEEVEPVWVPDQFCGERRQWDGTFDVVPAAPAVSIVGCSFDGKLTHFRRHWPWSRAQSTTPQQPSGIVFAVLMVATILLVFGATAYMARRNLLIGRGDRRGALGIGLFMFGITMGLWVVGSDHVTDVFAEFEKFNLAISASLYPALMAWSMYLALEPIVRRRWPRVLVSWSRLVSGRARDPLVAGHVLIGACFGVSRFLLGDFARLLPGWIDVGPPQMTWFGAEALRGTRFVVWEILAAVQGAIEVIMFLFLLVLARAVLRRPLVAVASTVVVYALLTTGPSDPFWILFASNMASAGLIAFCLIRFGLLAAAVATVVAALPARLPLPSDLGAWYSMPAWTGFFLVATLLVAAFYFSLGERALVSTETLDGAPARS